MERMLQSDEYVVNLLFLLRFVERMKSQDHIARHCSAKGLADRLTANHNEQETR